MSPTPFSPYRTCPVYLAEHWTLSCANAVAILHGFFRDEDFSGTREQIADLDGRLRAADRWLRTEIGGYRVDDWQRYFRAGRPYRYCGHDEPSATLYMLELCRDYRDDLRLFWRGLGWDADSPPRDDFYSALDPGAVAHQYRRLALVCRVAPAWGPPGTLPDTSPVAAAMAHERTRTQIELSFRRLHNQIPREHKAADGASGPDPPCEQNGKRRPLTDPEQVVLDIIRAQPPGTGIIGKKILAEAKKRGKIISSESTLTRHIIPVLKQGYQVRNGGGGRGYYVALPA
jgi:hypothetical protein